MREPLQIEGSAPANGKRVAHQFLQRNDGLLPVQLAKRALVGAPDWLHESSGGNVPAA